MSSLSVTTSAVPDLLAALRRARPPAMETPLIDAPRTHLALSTATASWVRAAHHHAESRELHFSEALRFLHAVSRADDHLAGRLR